MMLLCKHTVLLAVEIFFVNFQWTEHWHQSSIINFSGHAGYMYFAFSDLKFPKMKFKGVKQSSVIRTKTKEVIMVQCFFNSENSLIPLWYDFPDNNAIDKWLKLVNVKLGNKMWKVNWSAWHERGTKKKSESLSDRNWTHDLPNTRWVLYPLS